MQKIKEETVSGFCLMRTENLKQKDAKESSVVPKNSNFQNEKELKT